jgi:hypothetical protein
MSAVMAYDKWPWCSCRAALVSGSEVDGGPAVVGLEDGVECDGQPRAVANPPVIELLSQFLQRLRPVPAGEQPPRRASRAARRPGLLHGRGLQPVTALRRVAGTPASTRWGCAHGPSAGSVHRTTRRSSPLGGDRSDPSLRQSLRRFWHWRRRWLRALGTPLFGAPDGSPAAPPLPHRGSRRVHHDGIRRRRCESGEGP